MNRDRDEETPPPPCSVWSSGIARGKWLAGKPEAPYLSGIGNSPLLVIRFVISRVTVCAHVHTVL